MRWLRSLATLLVVATLPLAGCSTTGNDEPARIAATEDSTEGGPTDDADPNEAAGAAGGAADDEEADEPADVPAPASEWPRADPAEVGLTREGLDALADFVEPKGTNCLAVVKDGRLVDERYWNGTDEASDHEIFSASKSVSSTLVGIAQDQGLLDLDEAASTYLTEWQGTDSDDVTIRNLVSNDSGRSWDFETDYLQMTTADDRSAFSIGLTQQAEPGTTWVYNNAAIQTLEAVLERATGQDVEAYAQANLFGPIGMEASITRDSAGNPTTYTGVQAGCTDLARFGELYRRGGEWNGEQVVSAEWVEEAVGPSQDLNAAYGFLWWRNTDGGSVDVATGEPRDGLFWPDAPLDAYAALGLGNQIALVLPSESMVVTRVGGFGREGATRGGMVNDLARLAVAAHEPPG